MEPSVAADQRVEVHLMPLAIEAQLDPLMRMTLGDQAVGSAGLASPVQLLSRSSVDCQSSSRAVLIAMASSTLRDTAQALW